MLKVGIIVCALCTGAGGTVWWVKSDARSKEGTAPAVRSMPSFQELHANAHLEYLPVLTVNEPY